MISFRPSAHTLFVVDDVYLTLATGTDLGFWVLLPRHASRPTEPPALGAERDALPSWSSPVGHCPFRACVEYIGIESLTCHAATLPCATTTTVDLPSASASASAGPASGPAHQTHPPARSASSVSRTPNDWPTSGATTWVHAAGSGSPAAASAWTQRATTRTTSPRTCPRLLSRMAAAENALCASLLPSTAVPLQDSPVRQQRRLQLYARVPCCARAWSAQFADD